MGGLYRTVQVRTWRPGGSFSRLSVRAQLLFLHLLTGPHTTVLSGILVNVGPWALAEALLSKDHPTGWTDREVLEAFSELEAEGMAVADWGNRIILLPAAVRYNRPVNPNQAKAWAKAFQALPADAPLVASYYELLEQELEEAPESVRRTFFGAVRKPSVEPFRTDLDQTTTPVRAKGGASKTTPRSGRQLALGLDYKPAELRDDWNAICAPAGLAEVRSLGKTRYAKAVKFCRDIGSRERAQAVLRRLAASGRATGRNRNNWKATFDWLIGSDQWWRAVEEGQFDDKRNGIAGNTDYDAAYS